MNELSFNVDRNLRITSWEDGIAELTGISSRRAVGKRYFDVIPRIQVGDRDAVSDVLKKQKAVSIRKCRFGCLYAHITASVRISPVKNSKGSGRQATVTLRPATSCSMAKKLNRSQKFAAIGKIASTLAHGVKNPLNAIKGAVVYLRERYSHEEPLLEFTQIMEEEISRLEKFITQFLGSTEMQGEQKSVDINALIDRIKIFVSLQTYAHNIQCEFEVGEVPLLVVNPFYLEQALLNVINNAIEAMKSGGKLGIRTRSEQRPEGEYIVIEITDTGPGMNVESVEDLGLSRTSGRGFGLFIAYEMVKYYNGRLEINGEKDKGTTARFYLPCRNATGERYEGKRNSIDRR
jgi:two-component system, NtrC family, nitrogen regulation sensor histidine kinase GlnL